MKLNTRRWTPRKQNPGRPWPWHSHWFPLVVLVVIVSVVSHAFVVPVGTLSRESSSRILLSSTTIDPAHSFVEKRGLEGRLDKIERLASSTLGAFYEPHLTSFSVKPGSVDRLSVTSTCFAMQAALAGNDDAYESLIQLDLTRQQTDNEEDEKASDGGILSARTILRALLLSDWREDDLFQVPLLLYTVLMVDKDRIMLNAQMDEELASRIRRLTEAVLKARPRRRFGTTQTYSDYILFQCSQAYAALKGATKVPTPPKRNDVSDAEKEFGIGGLPLQSLPDGAANSLSLALARCSEVSANELCRQLAFRSAGDGSEFDVMRLAYSMLTYVTSTSSLSGTAGLELIPGDGPAAGTRVAQANMKLIRAALKAFFEEQLNDGLFDKGQPIYKSFRRQGRNVGNAFVFSLDTLGTVLRELPSEEFRPYLSQLERALLWVEQHQTVEVIPDYCDVESGQCYGKPLRGWSSPHLSPDTSPQAWCTAQALLFVSEMKRTIRELLHRDVLTEFQGVAYSLEGPVTANWNRLLDSDLGPCGGEDDDDNASDDSRQCRTLKQVLNSRVVGPFSESVANPSFGAAYSAILFGPPGTAKTTICESLARRMGWDFLVIDTSVFLADGLGNVAARIRYVFERLQVLDQCVILFDEIEEFCLDRETPNIGMESRMLTTAMLTAINDLRRAKRSVFFLATNRLRAFDSAITRPGRFDMQLFVGTPNLDSRVNMMRQQLVGVALSEKDKQAALQAYTDFLSANWKDSAMFMNYLEGMQFARACADLVQAGTKLSEKTLSPILETQKAVMTVRGSVREEFIASMGLSRL